MATLSSNFAMPTARKSTETDRRHLLADSIPPSSATSIIFDDGDATPRARSPVRPSASSSVTDASSIRRSTIAAPTPYRGFPSEEEYLAALRAWAETKKYIETDYMLKGFFGDKTMDDYIASGSGTQMSLGLRKKWKARKAKKADQDGEERGGRRNTVA